MTCDEALLDLLGKLKAHDYRFVTVTPETHARVLARPAPPELTLRDIFGWNRPFRPDQIDRELLNLLQHSGCIEEAAGSLRSLVRVASIEADLFLHSAFPTDAQDDVFFGPDTYRFAAFIRSQMPTIPSPRSIVDLGAGSGAGGVIASRIAPAARLTLVDINPAAMRLAAINCKAAGVDAMIEVGSVLPSGCELIVANPPYMIDNMHRTYRDGGGLYGGELTCEWARQALHALRSGGTLLLYTGAAIVDGDAPLLDRIRAICREASATFSAVEIDPDVFGEELEEPAYRDVERIAATGLRLQSKGLGSGDIVEEVRF